MEKNDKKNFDIDFAPEALSGTYSNLVIISHSPSEFVIDFAQSLPGTKNPVVRQRIVMNPFHTKRFLKALVDNVSKFEKNFGEIDEAPANIPTDTVPYDIIGKA